MEPVSTPYDILPIPYFAYVPGISIWLASFAALLLFYFFLKAWTSKDKAVFDYKGLQEAIKELDSLHGSLSSAANRAVVVSKASLIFRRALSLIQPGDYASMSSKEIQEVMSSASASARPLFENLLLLEDARYRGGDLSSAKELIGSILSSLRTIERGVGDA